MLNLILLMTKDLAEFDDWTFESIKRRQENLSEHVLEYMELFLESLLVALACVEWDIVLKSFSRSH